MWGTSICPAVRRWQRHAGSARRNSLGAILLPPLAHHLARDLALVTNRSIATRPAPCTATATGAAILGGIIRTGATPGIGGDRCIDDLLPDLRIGRRLALLGIRMRCICHTGDDDQQQGCNIFHGWDFVFPLDKKVAGMDDSKQPQPFFQRRKYDRCISANLHQMSRLPF